MARTTGRLVTLKSSQYLQQLCKHFAHKTAVSYTETTGSVALRDTAVQLLAEGPVLTASFEASDAESRAILCDVIDRHLARFAFREGIEKMDWQTETVRA